MTYQCYNYINFTFIATVLIGCIYFLLSQYVLELITFQLKNVGYYQRFSNNLKLFYQYLFTPLGFSMISGNTTKMFRIWWQREIGVKANKFNYSMCATYLI